MKLSRIGRNRVAKSLPGADHVSIDVSVPVHPRLMQSGGEFAGEPPIEQPDRFSLLINLRTVTAIGVTNPQSLLVRADEVIE